MDIRLFSRHSKIIKIEVKKKGVRERERENENDCQVIRKVNNIDIYSSNGNGVNRNKKKINDPEFLQVCVFIHESMRNNATCCLNLPKTAINLYNFTEYHSFLLLYRFAVPQFEYILLARMQLIWLKWVECKNSIENFAFFR